MSRIDKRHRKWDPIFDDLFFSAWFNHGNNVDVLRVILEDRDEKLGLISELGIPIEELKEQISEIEKKKLFFNRLNFFIGIKPVNKLRSFVAGFFSCRTKNFFMKRGKFTCWIYCIDITC